MRGAEYARYSSDNQREESIDAQLYEIREYASKNDITIVKTYTDEARTATTDDRPGFQAMVRDAKIGLFDTLLIHKLDRFARNRYDSAIYKRELKRAGVKIISITERLDDSPESVILESVLEGVAEYYSKNLAREAMKGLKENARHCRHNGGLPPLGLAVDKQTRQYIPGSKNEVDAVKLIFNLYDQGLGYDKIINELNAKGYKTKIGRNFAKNSLYGILRNEKYIGTYIYNRSAPKTGGKRNHHKSKPEEEITRVEDAFPGIIEKELFWRVQKKMNKRKLARARNKAKTNYLVSGLIYCGECGAAMVGNSKTYQTKQGKVRHHYYECNRRDRKKDCTNPQIKKDTVDNFVLEELQRKIFNQDNIPILVKKINEFRVKQQTEGQNELTKLNKSLNEVTSQLDNLVGVLAMGAGQVETIVDKIKELEANKTLLQNLIKELDQKIKATCITQDMIETYLDDHRQQVENKDMNSCKKFISNYIDNVTVYRDTIEIHILLDIDGGGGPYRAITRINKFT